MEEYFEYMLFKEKLGWYVIGGCVVIFLIVCAVGAIAEIIRKVKEKKRKKEREKRNGLR